MPFFAVPSLSARRLDARRSKMGASLVRAASLVNSSCQQFSAYHRETYQPPALLAVLTVASAASSPPSSPDTVVLMPSLPSSPAPASRPVPSSPPLTQPPSEHHFVTSGAGTSAEYRALYPHTVWTSGKRRLVAAKPLGYEIDSPQDPFAFRGVGGSVPLRGIDPLTGKKLTPSKQGKLSVPGRRNIGPRSLLQTYSFVPLGSGPLISVPLVTVPTVLLIAPAAVLMAAVNAQPPTGIEASASEDEVDDRPMKKRRYRANKEYEIDHIVDHSTEVKFVRGKREVEYRFTVKWTGYDEPSEHEAIELWPELVNPITHPSVQEYLNKKIQQQKRTAHSMRGMKGRQ